MRVERIEVEFPADVGGTVGAKDIEGEGAEPGEVARFVSNAAMVFKEGDIADVVASVFDAPMLADRGADGGGGQSDLRRKEGCLVGGMPEAGRGVLVPGEPGDADGGNDQAVPVGAEAAGDVERLDPTILLSAMAVAVDGLGAVGGRVDGTDRFDPVVQDLLVGFDLGDEKASCILGRFKGFFDSASHRR